MQSQEFEIINKSLTLSRSVIESSKAICDILNDLVDDIIEYQNQINKFIDENDARIKALHDS